MYFAFICWFQVITDITVMLTNFISASSPLINDKELRMCVCVSVQVDVVKKDTKLDYGA